MRGKRSREGYSGDTPFGRTDGGDRRPTESFLLPSCPFCPPKGNNFSNEV